MAKHLRTSSSDPKVVVTNPNAPARHFAAAVASKLADATSKLKIVGKASEAEPEVKGPDANTTDVDATEGEKDDDAAKKTQAAVGRSAALMSVLVIISRITGFFRTWGQAYALGVTALASCYTVANNLPNQLYELVMGGMIMTAFLPVYMSVKKRLGRKGADDYASNLISIVTVILAIVTVLSWIFAGFIIWTQSFSASKNFNAGVSEYLFRFFVVEVILYALDSLISGVLNAERDYLWSNAAPIFNNIVCTASFVLYALLVPTNKSLAVLCLAIGNPLGVLVQVLVQVPSLRRHGIRIRFHIDLHDPALKETLSIGVPTLVLTLVSFPTVAVQTSSALQVTAAGASIAYYARLWYMLPYSVFAIPITIALFTELSDYVANDDMESFKRAVRFGTERIVFMLVPFAMFLVIFAPGLITILAAGKFDAKGLQNTILYLGWLATALPFYGVSTYLQKICSSLRKMVFLTIATCVAAAVQIGFCFAFTSRLGLAGVAFSSTLFFIAIDVVTYLNLRRTLGPIGLRSMFASFVRSLAFGVAGTAVAVVLLALLNAHFGNWLGSMSRSILYCVAAGVPAVLVTYGLPVLFKAPEASTIQSILARFGRKKKVGAN